RRHFQAAQSIARVVTECRVDLSYESLRRLRRLALRESQGGADVGFVTPEVRREEPRVGLVLPRVAQFGHRPRVQLPPGMQQRAATRVLRGEGREQRERPD